MIIKHIYYIKDSITQISYVTTASPGALYTDTI